MHIYFLDLGRNFVYFGQTDMGLKCENVIMKKIALNNKICSLAA